MKRQPATLTPTMAYGAYYAAQFGFLGVQLPFFPGWLDSRGFSAEAIGLLAGGALALRLLFAPPLAFKAEASRDPRTPLRVVSAVMAGAACLLLVDLSPPLIASIVVLVMFLFGLAVPLADAAVLRADRAGQLDYGRTRGVGSFAFIVANLAGGAVITATSDQGAVVIMAAMGIGMLAASLVIPAPGGPPRERPSLREALVLFRSKSFILMLIAGGLCQGSHATYYSFSELHWSALGYSSALIGVLWTVGVVVEIAVLYHGRLVVRRIDPALLIAIGGAAAAIRWPLIGLSPPLPVLIGLQMLHAGTFTAAFLGTIEFVGRAVPSSYQATAMTLVSTFGIGAVTGVATVVAGQLFVASQPVAAYGLMGAMGAAGTVLALMLRSRWDGGLVRAASSLKAPASRPAPTPPLPRGRA